MTMKHLVRLALLFAVLTCFGISRGTARAAEDPEDRFTSAPVFSQQGFAATVFRGGTAAQLESAIAAVGGKGAWVNDPTNTPRLMIVSGSPTIVKAFAAWFPSDLGVVPVTLIGTPHTTTDAAAAAASGAEFTQSHGLLPAPPTRSASETSSMAASASNVARIVAPHLGLDHYIEDIGIVDGAMDTPHDASYAVGWYYTYDAPGVAGNAIFSAHETWNHWQAPFYGLYRTKAGDEVALDMTSGARYHYRVISHQRYDVETMPMADILWPTNRAKGAQWITLITCGGRLVYDESGFGEYLDRDVVVAERVD